MMNLERITVGVQGLGISEIAYQNSVTYAKERKQGKRKWMTNAYVVCKKRKGSTVYLPLFPFVFGLAVGGWMRKEEEGLERRKKTILHEPNQWKPTHKTSMGEQSNNLI